MTLPNDIARCDGRALPGPTDLLDPVIPLSTYTRALSTLLWCLSTNPLPTSACQPKSMRIGSAHD